MNASRQTQVTFVPVRRRILAVRRVVELAPDFRRIVLAGADLEADFPFADFAPTDHVKLFFPQPDTGEIVIPEVTEQGWVLPDGSPAPIYRDYTVRAFDADAGELTIDFVLHPHGVAGRWAGSASVGDRLGVLGPRGNVRFPRGYAHYLAAGDETAIPALMRLIEELPTTAKATVLIEVASAQHEQAVPVRDGVRVRWVHRAAAGEASALESAVRAVDLTGDVFAFAAGEAGAMRPIRRYLREHLPTDQVDVDGYWKRGVANLDHHSVELD